MGTSASLGWSRAAQRSTPIVRKTVPGSLVQASIGYCCQRRRTLRNRRSRDADAGAGKDHNFLAMEGRMGHTIGTHGTLRNSFGN